MEMNELSALIHNFNCDCHKQYTQVSNYLGNRLDESLKEIERFYYSPFWVNRLERRLNEAHIDYTPIDIDIILGVTSELREDTQFKMFDESQSSKGVSNKSNMIALNVNMKSSEINDSHINNVIMHEFGHRQYNQDAFDLVVRLNRKIIGSPGLYMKNNQNLSENDYLYFMDHNELRQRIIPVIKEMWDNRWTLEEVYDKSENLKIDDIKEIFSESYILYLIDNLL